MPRIEFEHLTKMFVRRSGEKVRAIDDVSLTIEDGEFLVLLGPSGCGKTTMLRSVAGLETPSHGKIAVGDRVLYDSDARKNVPPEDRRMGMIFQSYALWPHMTVFDNVAYPLRSKKAKRKEVETSVKQTLADMHIAHLADQYPGQISGGQQQRVALARALVAAADVVLFDEPLSNVDAKVRDHLRLEIKRMHRELGFTAIYVTHDQEEAMALASRIAVLKDGRIDQIGTPQEVYGQPRTLSVAQFVGSLNEFSGRVAGVADGRARIDVDGLGEVEVDRSDLAVGTTVTVGVRPEDVVVRPLKDASVAAAPNHWAGSVDLALYLGPRRQLELNLGASASLKAESSDPLLAEEMKVVVSVASRHFIVFPTDEEESA